MTRDQSLVPAIDRRNILNNPSAIDLIQEQVGFTGQLIEGEYRFTIRDVASFYEVEVRTIERYLARFTDELRINGYEIFMGKRLEEAKKVYGTDMNVGTLSRLGLFNFRSFLNIGMLLSESEKAKALRSLILDIALDVVSEQAGGSTKYINQRDEAYLISLYAGEHYRKDFIDALKDHVEMGNFKYAVYTNKIYKSIFNEHARDYRAILSLSTEDKVRDTMYAEVLTTISMYETGLAHEIRNQSKERGRKLIPAEVDALFERFAAQPALEPQIQMARTRMASRDYGLRSVTHPELITYVYALDTSEFERFLGEKSQDLAKQIKREQAVFRRLKDK